MLNLIHVVFPAVSNAKTWFDKIEDCLPEEFTLKQDHCYFKEYPSEVITSFADTMLSFEVEGEESKVLDFLLSMTSQPLCVVSNQQITIQNNSTLLREEYTYKSRELVRIKFREVLYYG